LSLTTDIIVGFPGETRADFEQTLDLIREIKFDSAYTFIYSKRIGTKAAEFKDIISEEEKSLRFRELLDVLGEIGDTAYMRYIGKTMRVLCEGKGRTGRQALPGKRSFTGKSREGVIVDFDGVNISIGEFVDVKIDGALKWAILGQAVN
jgi:tRNA-2-methylthio-N6-dimethylallyladenosine synthase